MLSWFKSISYLPCPQDNILLKINTVLHFALYPWLWSWQMEFVLLLKHLACVNVIFTRRRSWTLQAPYSWELAELLVMMTKADGNEISTILSVCRIYTPRRRFHNSETAACIMSSYKLWCRYGPILHSLDPTNGPCSWVKSPARHGFLSGISFSSQSFT